MDIEELFAVAGRFVPEELLDAAGWAKVLDRVSNDLPGPALMSNVLGFEFRLWEDDPSADFGPTLVGSTALVDSLVDRGRTSAPGSRAQALGDFLSQLSGDGWPANGALEYDVVGVPSDENPDPGLFMNTGPYPENTGAPHPVEVVGIIADVLGLPRDDNELEAVQRVCEALPTGAFVYHVGTMPSRPQRAVRVAVEGVEADDVGRFLGQIGWAGPIGLVEETLTDMLSVAARFALALDVAPHGPLPHIGLEVSTLADGLTCYDGWLASTRRDWRQLTEHLVARDLCLPHKGEALLKFCGLDPILGPDGVLNVYRALVGPKIVARDSGVQAKAYAGVLVFPAA